MKIKVVLSLTLSLCLAIWGGAQEASCFEGIREKMVDFAFKDFDSPQAAHQAKMKIVEDLVGCEMPAFEARTLEGKRVSNESLKGKVVVMNFWFIGCPPCEKELPGLNKLVEKFGKKEIVFLAFGRDKEEKVREYLEKHEFNYQQIPQSSAPGVFPAFEVRFGYPYHLVFDTDGKLVFAKVGSSITDENYMYKVLKPVLEKVVK